MRFPFPPATDFGYQREVAPGVHWLRLPLPFNPEDHINVWLLEDAQGVAIIDTGLADDETRRLWQAALARLGGSPPIRRVYLSHHHPDHLGLAAGFEQSGASIHLAEAERQLAEDLMRPDDCDVMATIYRRHGMPIQRADVADLRRRFYRDHVQALPRQSVSLCDGERFVWGADEWGVQLVGGHTPAHALFHCPAKKLLIAGDHILPEIVTNIGSLSFDPHATPVADYLDTLMALETLPDDTLVLPAHGQPFVGLPARCRQLREIHHERLAGVLHACARADTLWAMLPHLYGRELKGLGAVLGFNQTKAYLDYLVARGRVGVRQEAEGTCRFQSLAVA